MAYETGTFTGSDGFNVIQTKLAAFAVANGWTANYNTFPYLCLSKSDCFVNFYFNETPTLDDGLNSGNPVADYTINSHLSTGFTAGSPAATQYVSQPGSLVSAATGGLSSANQVACNDLTGPYANYWFFTGADGDPNYIIMVIQNSLGRYSMMAFGDVDKKGSTYTGGAFLHAIKWNWGFASTSGPPGEFTSGQGSDWLTGNHKWIGDASANYNLWLGDLEATAKMFSHANNNNLTALMSRQTLFPSYGLSGTTSLGFLYGMFFIGTNPINGVSVFFEVPLFRNDTTNSRIYYIGTLPGFRWLSMINRYAAEEILLGSDEWIVFPFKQTGVLQPEPYAQRVCDSGPFGYACKVNT